MIKDFITSMLADYQKLVIAKFLLAVCLVGGFMLAVLILAIGLMLLYPLYVWCVVGGFVIIWFLSLLILYGYFRIAQAENRTRIAQLESIEHYLKILTVTLTTVVEHFTKSKRK